MIIKKEYIKDLEPIVIKLILPQVGSRQILYQSFLDITDELLDFIINKEGELLIGRGHYKLNKKNEKLYFAGRLKIKNGLIYYIDNDSGHYSPSHKDLDDIYNVMKIAGIISKDAEKKYL